MLAKNTQNTSNKIEKRINIPKKIHILNHVQMLDLMSSDNNLLNIKFYHQL